MSVNKREQEEEEDEDEDEDEDEAHTLFASSFVSSSTIKQLLFVLIMPYN